MTVCTQAKEGKKSDRTAVTLRQPYLRVVGLDEEAEGAHSTPTFTCACNPWTILLKPLSGISPFSLTSPLHRIRRPSFIFRNANPDLQRNSASQLVSLSRCAVICLLWKQRTWLALAQAEPAVYECKVVAYATATGRRRRTNSETLLRSLMS